MMFRHTQAADSPQQSSLTILPLCILAQQELLTASVSWRSLARLCSNQVSIVLSPHSILQRLLDIIGAAMLLPHLSWSPFSTCLRFVPFIVFENFSYLCKAFRHA